MEITRPQDQGQPGLEREREKKGMKDERTDKKSRRKKRRGVCGGTEGFRARKGAGTVQPLISQGTPGRERAQQPKTLPSVTGRLRNGRRVSWGFLITGLVRNKDGMELFQLEAWGKYNYVRNTHRLTL